MTSNVVERNTYTGKVAIGWVIQATYLHQFLESAGFPAGDDPYSPTVLAQYHRWYTHVGLAEQSVKPLTWFYYIRDGEKTLAWFVPACYRSKGTGGYMMKRSDGIDTVRDKLTEAGLNPEHLRKIVLPSDAVVMLF